MQWLARSELLTYEELARVARVCVERWGFDGDPDHRWRADGPGPPPPPVRAARVRSGVDLAMTTNGVRLPELAHDLAAAGLRRVNISLDTPPPRDVPGADPPRRARPRSSPASTPRSTPGSAPVKMNCVVIRGVNDDEVVDLAAFGRDRGVGVRFIEFMPLDAPGRLDDGPGRARRSEILDRIDAVFPLERGPDRTAARTSSPRPGSATATGIGDVGVIASVTEPFCESCDRVRITAEGKFRTCLFALEETDLRAASARRRHRRRARRRRSRLRSAPSGPGTGSARSTFVRPGPLDEPDRRVAAPAPPRLAGDGLGVHAPRPARSGPHGRRVGQGPEPPAGRRPLPGLHGARHRVEDRLRARSPRVTCSPSPGSPGIQAAKQTANLLPAVPPAARRLGVRELPHRGAPRRGREPRSTRSTGPASRWRR